MKPKLPNVLIPVTTSYYTSMTNKLILRYQYYTLGGGEGCVVALVCLQSKLLVAITILLLCRWGLSAIQALCGSNTWNTTTATTVILIE